MSIILGILFCAIAIILFIIGMIFETSNDLKDIKVSPTLLGVIGGCVLTMGIYFQIPKEPTPLDVYRGNTTLEVTSVNGVPIDSVVVFKRK